ncbi:MAG: hypothetical protein FJ088_11650, partial [Deltaproteobacteria bacterium]|nr:hypothetical protein [Deltaproteobacteria bacterium]
GSQGDAKTPEAEKCDKIDNDCNSLTDDFSGEMECFVENQFGKCPGKGLCVEGQVDCKGQTPAPEQCNGIDDNCDGKTDEGLCFDGKPCTQDICDQFTGKCVFKPIAGECDDGNLCTDNDHCENGECVPGSFKNCDDNNPCTDNKCDTGTGKCFNPNNSNPCEDGNQCTEGDYCQNGGCKAGGPKNCDDNNICTNESCNQQQGCIYTPNNGLACDDKNACTVEEKCSGGLCLGGKDFCWNKVCTPVPPQIFCLQPTCFEAPIIGPTCPCVCF